MRFRCQIRNGFTIAEILVVIAIIVLLASIVLGVARNASTRAKSAVCISNLHQIQLALQLYRTDNGAYPPDALDGPVATYFGGSTFTCPVAVANDSGRTDHYFLQADQTVSKLSGSTAHGGCQEARGGSCRDRNRRR